MSNLLRFDDLKRRGIVRNWPQLRRLIASAGFPAGFLLSANARVWDESEIDAWVDRRRGRPLETKTAQAAA